MSEGTAEASPKIEKVSITVDGQQIQVPKGTNLIEAARIAGVDIPYYCYHPDLSIAGNCRMCQVEVNKNPKLAIGCNTAAQEGMEVATHCSSKAVADAQAATLEFILINHPLDCTVCDQAGHCKLQDYHYEYNARASRFDEDKVHKPKAKVLGPTVILDAERCIMCTRCVRFCDEVTETSELGMINRGDKAEITVNESNPLNNPLSGTVVDLCPVGALTHREWRFNTRIWFTKQVDSVCPGCSTGCNVKVAERDGEVVQVKGRYNADVNKEWLCDEGRYGFDRFLPKERIIQPTVRGKVVDISEAIEAASLLVTRSSENATLVLLSPDLLLEDYVAVKQFLDGAVHNYVSALAYWERSLSPVEAKLVSPDYACNFKGAIFAGLVDGDIAAQYTEALKKLEAREFRQVIVIGDRALPRDSLTPGILSAIESMSNSLGILADRTSPLTEYLQTVIPGRVVLEKSGLMINRSGRVQHSQQIVNFPEGTEPEWRVFARWSDVVAKGKILEGKVTVSSADRDVTRALLATHDRLQGIKLSAIKGQGVVV